jgi:hypothetical protein
MPLCRFKKGVGVIIGNERGKWGFLKALKTCVDAEMDDAPLPYKQGEGGGPIFFFSITQRNVLLLLFDCWQQHYWVIVSQPYAGAGLVPVYCCGI